MKKIGLAIIMVLVIVFALIASSVYAECRGRGEQGGCYDGAKTIFSKKVGMVCKNKDALGISNEQMEKIETLKSAIEKDLIRVNAEIDIIGIDLRTEVRKDKIDTEAVNKLIDKKYDLKKEKAKSMVAAIAKLKEVLTEEQREKMKTLCESAPWRRHHEDNEEKKTSTDKDTK